MTARIAIRYFGATFVLMFMPVLSHVYAQDVAEDVSKSDILLDMQKQIDELTDSISGIEFRIIDELVKRLKGDLAEQQVKFIEEQNVKMKQMLDNIGRLDATLTTIQRELAHTSEESRKSLDHIEKQSDVIQEALAGLDQEFEKLETRQRKLAQGSEDYWKSLDGQIKQQNDMIEKAHDGLVQEVKRRVKESNGLDYLQVFKSNRDRVIFLIDSLDREMNESGGFDPKENHSTLMFGHEY